MKGLSKLKVLQTVQSAPPMDSLEALYCHIDDFCRSFEPQWRQTLLGYGVQQRDRK